MTGWSRERLRQLRPRVAVLDGPLPPDLVLATIGELSAIVAMRYHAMLFAERAGVPLIPISYADKTERWVTEHGLRSVRPDGHGPHPPIARGAVRECLRPGGRAS